MKALIKKVHRTIDRYNMLGHGDLLVAGVSGGPDSVVLLHVLKELQKVLCFSLVVAHLDHRVRADSRKDYRFVARLSAALGFPFHGGVLKRSRLSNKGSLEEQLRLHRYSFLKAICRKVGANMIVLAHTRDDQAETVLMRLLRGSGLHGLSAIQPKIDNEGIHVIRPLIEIGKDEILKVAAVHKIRFCIDPTNRDEKIFRNKIRRRLLPLLEREYNPNIREILAKTADTVGADYAYLAAEARAFFSGHSFMRNDRCFIDLSALSVVAMPLRRLALRLAIEKVKGNLHRISFRHLEEIEDLIFSRPRGSKVHLPSGLTIEKTKENLAVYGV